MSRFNFTLDNDEGLQWLAEQTGRAKAQVVRDALTLYQYIVRELMEGNKVFLGPDKDKVAPLLITQLQRLQRQRQSSADS